MFELSIYGILGAIIGMALSGLYIYFEIKRINRKLSPENKPSRWQFINELGGYFVLGVIIFVMCLVSLVMALINAF